MIAEKVPAAQYLRMSTDHQQYSLGNQTAAIAQWADEHGFEVAKTYADAGKSGLLLRNRTGLISLLQDVAEGRFPYKAILVYDVSRWGRFQDSDEAAFYEFMCKSAGVAVHYCNELFTSGTAIADLVLKALRRCMAGEFSRDMSGKTYFTQKRAAQQGFWVSSQAGYGLRRLILDKQGHPKQIVEFGERKCLQSDRERLVFGPKHEVECVKRIFEMLINSGGKIGPTGIARHLNRMRISRNGKEWTDNAVNAILSNPKYCGIYIWGRRQCKLKSKLTWNPPDQWVIVENAFPAIVSRQTFELAQKLRPHRTHRYSSEEMLERCKRLLGEKGRLSQTVINAAPKMPSAATYWKYFGSLQNLYDLIGYKPLDRIFLRQNERAKALRLRGKLFAEIVERFPKNISSFKPAPNHRRLLLIDNVLPLSVIFARSYNVRSARGWVVTPVHRERNCLTLMCALDMTNGHPEAFYLLPRLDRCHSDFKFKLGDAWISQFDSFTDLSELYSRAWSLQGDRPIRLSGLLNNRFRHFTSGVRL